MKRFFAFVLALVLFAGLVVSCSGSGTTVKDTPAAPISPSTPVAKTPTATSAEPPKTTAPKVTETPTPPQTTAATAGKDYQVASLMVDFFYTLSAVNRYYQEGVSAMAKLGPGSGALTAASGRPFKLMLAGYSLTSYADSQSKIPPEFSDTLPSGGWMPAPPGACPAAAEPNCRFVTENGEVITPDLLQAKDVRILPVELINAPQDDPDSLLSLLRKLMPGRDSRLGTPEGWNTLFWDKVKEFQVPAKSLIDYQTWTLSGDLEKQIVASFRQGMIDGGISPFALNAFDQSNISGWAAANPPTPGDAISLMDIQAVLSGSVEGTVHEWREFRIPRLGSDPVFGVQYGNGTVTMNLPGYGPMDAVVDIRFDQFDELGKAVGGTVTAIPLDVDGYRVVFTYKPDGSKEGQVFDPNGNIVGYLTMAVDHDRFTNYVSIKEGTEIKLPLPEPTPTKPSSTIIVQ